MAGKGIKWTVDEDQKLRQWAAEGMRVRHVALKLRRSESAIRHRARTLNVKVHANDWPRFRFADTPRASTK